MSLSVVLCTHNPRPAYLARVLGALRDQTLHPQSWELLVIDNASKPPVADLAGVDLPPQSRILVEDELGLTAARLRGISEARGEVLVFVDDDNLLAPDYLERCAALAEDWPMLGVWGCGRYTAEWEEQPPSEMEPYLSYLAVGARERDSWSNHAFDYAAMPAGAGLCVRASVARRYAESVRGDARRKLLGRSGTGLSGCEDFDLALTAIELGYGTGVFRELEMIHLMPRDRVQENYLLKLVEGHARSTVLLMALHGRPPRPKRGLAQILSRIGEWRLRRSLGPVHRRIHDARRRGENAASQLLRNP